MGDNKLKRISFPEVRELARDMQDEISAPYVARGIGVLLSGTRTLVDILTPGAPYIIEECRLAVVKRGSISVTINMIDYTATENTIIFFGTGCIVQPRGFSDDVELHGIMLSNERIGMAFGDTVPPALAGNGMCLFVQATQEEVDVADSMLGTMWKLIHQPSFSDGAVNGLIRSLLYYFEHLGRQRATANAGEQSRERRIFEQFMRLINMHCHSERALGFYADKLCVTPRYLGVVVRNASGITAKEWVDRAVITTAKVLLAHGDKQIADIAYELNFPNPSFFCKFFKRITGYTPQGYRMAQQ